MNVSFLVKLVYFLNIQFVDLTKYWVFHRQRHSQLTVHSKTERSLPVSWLIYMYEYCIVFFYAVSFRRNKPLTEYILCFFRAPPTFLSANARYDVMMISFGGKGYFCETAPALKDAFAACMACNEPCLINVMIDPTSQRKQQDFNWLTRSKM